MKFYFCKIPFTESYTFQYIFFGQCFMVDSVADLPMPAEDDRYTRYWQEISVRLK